MKTLIILPTQLFEETKLLSSVDKIYILEEPFYFTNLPFHKQKLVLHRASMKYYAEFIKKYKPEYIEYNKINKSFYNDLEKVGTEIFIYDPIDIPIIELYDGIFKDKIKYIDTPAFMETRQELDEYREKYTNKKNYYHDNSFYKWQRRRLNIIVDEKQVKPLYGKWSFDKENRNKYDNDYKEIKIKTFNNKYVKEAKIYIQTNFPNNFGLIDEFYYPTTHKEAKAHFKLFINKKLGTFGKYEDGVRNDIVYGSHANISSLLNNGLLIPSYVIKETLKIFNNDEKIISSVEGFIRQVIGWRSFSRFIYIYHGKNMSKENFFNNNHDLSNKWYSATTKIPVIDDLIKKAEKYAYLHHIERLMYIGNFALINQIKPTDIYKWFMICFIDSYEWVMMPNVYGMSQYSTTTFSMMTRPYISSTNYIKNMSNYKDSKIIINDKEYSWFEIWNALYYNFINDNKEKLRKIYAVAMQVKYLMNMNEKTKLQNIKLATFYMKY